VQIQVGLMDDRGHQIRGTRVTVKLSKYSDAQKVAEKAQEQMQLLDCHFIHRSYVLCYPDGRSAVTLPSSGAPFTVISYREMLLVDYSKIVLFLRAPESG